MKLELKQQFRIESARVRPGLPEGHPCRRMHGHSFLLSLRLVGEQDPKIGWVRDYHEIAKIVQKILGDLDHRVLNEVPGLENPTSENLAIYLFNRLKKDLKELVQVTVSETPDTECSYPSLLEVM